MKKKIGIICVLLFVVGLIVTVVAINNNSVNGDSENKTTVTISVFNKEGTNIYNESIETEKEYLVDVLNEIEELKVVIEDSEYGAFITSIMGVEQGDNFYWSYYIGDEYATVGVSNCKIEEGKTYNLKIENFNSEGVE